MVSDRMLGFADMEHRIQLVSSQAEEQRQLGDVGNEPFRQRFVFKLCADVVQFSLGVSARSSGLHETPNRKKEFCLPTAPIVLGTASSFSSVQV